MYVFYLFLINVIVTQCSGELVKVSDKCIFKDKNQIYDLTTLATENYWIYSDKTPKIGMPFHLQNKDEILYHVSICHPVRHSSSVGPKCEGNVCFSSKPPGDSSLAPGEFKSGGKSSQDYIPILQDAGHLKFTFENGSLCDFRGKKVKYKTEIYLQCPIDGEEETTGPIIMSPFGCIFVFVWLSKAACPRKHIAPINQNCSLQFPDSLSVNLNILNKKTFYGIKGGHKKFEINFCGPIVNGSCDPGTSVCDITDKDNPKPLAISNTQIIDWNIVSGYPEIMFKNGNISVGIELNCNKKYHEPRVNFLSQNVTKTKFDYFFRVRTVVACLPFKGECVIEDSDMNVYDLRSLYRKNNWNVYALSFVIQRAVYHINICGPINHNKTAQCPPGPIGACKSGLFKHSKNTALNLGYMTSSPVVKDDKSISILYTGGDSCREGVASSSTLINLFCSNSLFTFPRLVEVTDDCQHIFEWHTPAACPVNYKNGTDCVVKDPLHGGVFDLNPLRNRTSDYIAVFGYEKFKINVCGPLVSGCANDKDAGICKSKFNGNEEISAGKANTNLIFNDGTISAVYTNGSKCGNSSWFTRIVFVCDHKAENQAPMAFPSNSALCMRNVIWPTIHACPAFKTIDCYVVVKNKIYDLSPLSNSAENQVYVTSNSKKFVFNICRSVVHSKESRCPYNSGACLIDTNHKDDTVNLGQVLHSPYLEDEKLMIHYTNGDMCNATHRYETLIMFVCTIEFFSTFPRLVADGQTNSECLTVFEWHTAYACPQTMETPNIGNCTVKNPITGYVYDLSSLSTSVPKILHLGDDTSLLLNVCGPVNQKECARGAAGSCLFTNQTAHANAVNMGMANSNLQFNRWTIFLEYKNGDECMPNVNKSTIIRFICRNSASPKEPVVVENEKKGCTILVNWYTDEVCERPINCFAKTSTGVYDLSKFVMHLGNYEVQDPNKANTTYYINICRHLNPMKEINCDPNASACMVEKSPDNSYNASSLGIPLLSPKVIGKDEVVLMYSHGSDCSKGFYSSRITFVCNETVGVGRPMFKKRTHDCQLQFEWKTTMVCSTKEKERNFDNQCHIYYDKAKANVDLTPLAKSGGYTVQHKNKTFKINICSPVCEKSGVCTTDGTSYGLASSSKLEWTGSNLMLKYFSGDLCSKALSNRRSSVIYFDCDMNAGYGRPESEPFINSESCVMMFSWRTNVTCVEAIYSRKEHVTQSPNVSQSTTQIYSTTSSLPSATVEPVAYEEGGTTMTIIVAIVVLTLFVALATILISRSRQGRHMAGQVKGFFSKKGDQAFILDDRSFNNML